MLDWANDWCRSCSPNFIRFIESADFVRAQTVSGISIIWRVLNRLRQQIRNLFIRRLEFWICLSEDWNSDFSAWVTVYASKGCKLPNRSPLRQFTFIWGRTSVSSRAWFHVPCCPVTAASLLFVRSPYATLRYSMRFVQLRWWISQWTCQSTHECRPSLVCWTQRAIKSDSLNPFKLIFIVSSLHTIDLRPISNYDSVSLPTHPPRKWHLAIVALHSPV